MRKVCFIPLRFAALKSQTAWPSFADKSKSISQNGTKKIPSFQSFFFENTKFGACLVCLLPRLNRPAFIARLPTMPRITNGPPRAVETARRRRRARRMWMLLLYCYIVPYVRRFPYAISEVLKKETRKPLGSFISVLLADMLIWPHALGITKTERKQNSWAFFSRTWMPISFPKRGARK